MLVGIFALGIGAIVRNTAGGIATFAGDLLRHPAAHEHPADELERRDLASTSRARPGGSSSRSRRPHSLSPGRRLALFAGYCASRSRSPPCCSSAATPDEDAGRVRWSRDDLELAAPSPTLIDARLVALLALPRRSVRPSHRHLAVPSRSHSWSARRSRCCWRRRSPSVVVAAVAAVALASIAGTSGCSRFQLGVALYTLAAIRSERRERAVGVAAIAAVAIAVRCVGRPGVRRRRCAGRFPGRRRAARRQHRLAARVRPRDRGEGGAARARAGDEARRAAAEEQARIARELHDVVAHALSVIVVQAGAADDVVRARPGARPRADPRDRAQPAARGARGPAPRARRPAARRAASYAAAAGPRALDRAGRAGARDRARRSRSRSRATPRPLPAGVDLSAYRIVQEALTNALKHARRRARAACRVRYDADAARSRSRDDGRRRGDTAAGARARADRDARARRAARRRTSTPARGRDGGFRVRAGLPLERERDDPRPDRRRPGARARRASG